MKNQTKKTIGIFRQGQLLGLYAPIATALLFTGIFSSCQKTDLNSMATEDAMDMRLHHSELTQTNLVGNNDEYSPVFIDPNVVNAWGLAFSDEGEIWVSAAETGMSFIYDESGATLMSPVTIPGGGPDAGPGNPTGMLYNTTQSFVIPESGEVSEFIFATENGTIAAWASGSIAQTVVDRSAEGAVYKGITFTKTISSGNFLYAADFHNARIDVFNSDFVYQPAIQFIDPDMPAGFAPFNVKAIDGLIYVTYAKQLGPDNMDDEAGPGNGYINIFTPNGSFVQRFASNGTLNSPWGITQTAGLQKAILVGNFGNGRISVFTSNGNFKSFLQVTEGVPVEIEGLWAIEFPGENLEGDAHNRLYFTAGPGEEEEGLFGYLDPVME
jgi:uncharacterized protein (TIGR03118 family)